MAQMIEILPHMEDKDLFILHIQYHACWWTGDTRSQGISSHGTDLYPVIFWALIQYKDTVLPV